MASGEIRIVRGACPHDCPDTCATITEVRDGKAISFRGDAKHPITQGWLCAKVRPYLDRVYHPERLTTPLRRVGPKGGGEFEPITWDEAIQEIAGRWQQIIAESGAQAILPFSFSGTLGLVQGTVSAMRLFNRMGASALQRTICDAAGTTATLATLGAKWAPDARDLKDARLVVIWGHNPASTGPHFMPPLREAQKNGTRVIVVDPRRSLTARSADLHVQPRPATDAALALGLMNVIFSEGLHDESWLEANSIGWRELRDRAAAYPVDRVSEITGIAADDIVAFAREFATTKPALLKYADGMQRNGNGGQAIRSLICLAAICGNIGTRGGGVFYSTSSYVVWDDEAVGHAAECPPPPRHVNMVRIGAALNGEVQDPPIRSLYIFNANPVASAPNSTLVIKGLQREDLFTVVHELFMTDTAVYADIVLPATTQLEQMDLHKGYGHRYLQFNHPAIAPLGESRSNWDVMRALAAAMGYDEPWLQQPAAEVIREILDVTKAKNPLLEGVTLDRLMEEGTIPLNFSAVSDVPFADLKFPTPSGKVELYSDTMRSWGVDPLPEYVPASEYAAGRRNSQLMLISAAAHHYVSTSMGNVPKLKNKEGTPFIQMHPEDAAARGISDGDEVIVENDRGWVRLVAEVTSDMQIGLVVSTKGQWPKLSPGGRNVNRLTSDALADLAGQSTFHSNLVEVRLATPYDVPSTDDVALAVCTD